MAVWVIVLLWETIFSRTSVPEPSVAYRPFHSLNNLIYYTKLYGIRNNLIGNILLFIPFGVLLPFAYAGGKKWYKIVLIGFSLSLFIETLQLITGRGYFDVDDIALNVIGAVIGWGLWRTVCALFERFRDKSQKKN